MRKLTLLLGAIIFCATLNAQGWDRSGNIISTGDFIGTTNNQDLIFKVNGIEGMRLRAFNNTISYTSKVIYNETIKLKKFRSPGVSFDRLVAIDDIGNLKLAVAPLISDLRIANGITFADGSVQTTALTGGSGSSVWRKNLNNIHYDQGFVGIGLTAPQDKLHVNGNIRLTRLKEIIMDGSEDLFIGNSVGGKMCFGGSGGHSKLRAVSNHIELGTIRTGGTSHDDIFFTTERNGVKTENMRIRGFNGYIGVATNSPQAMFDVNGNSYLRSNVGIGIKPASFAQTLIKANRNTTLCAITSDTDWGYGVKVVSKNPIHKAFAVNETESALKDNFVVFGNGRTKIGVSTADYQEVKLHVEADDKVAACFIQESTSDYDYGIKSVVGRNNHKAIAVINSTNQEQDVFRVMGNGHVWATNFKVALAKDFPDYVFYKDYDLIPLEELERFISKNKHLPNVPSAAKVKEQGLSLGDMQVTQMEKIEELTLYTISQQKSIELLLKSNETLKKEIEELKKNN